MLSCRYETNLLLVAARDGAFTFSLSGSKRLTLHTWENLGILPTGRFMFDICLNKRGVTSKQPESGVFHSAHSVNRRRLVGLNNETRKPIPENLRFFASPEGRTTSSRDWLYISCARDVAAKEMASNDEYGLAGHGLCKSYGSSSSYSCHLCHGQRHNPPITDTGLCMRVPTHPRKLAQCITEQGACDGRAPKVL